MENKWHNLFQSPEDVSPAVMLAYAKDELPPGQRNQVERLMLDYPYLADTIEGLEMLLEAGEDPAALLPMLEGQLAPATPEKPADKRSIGWWKYAAAAAVLVLGTWSIWRFQEQAPQELFTENTQQATSDSIEVAEDAEESTLEEVEEAVADREEKQGEFDTNEQLPRPVLAPEEEEVVEEEIAYQFEDVPAEPAKAVVEKPFKPDLRKNEVLVEEDAETDLVLADIPAPEEEPMTFDAPDRPASTAPTTASPPAVTNELDKQQVVVIEQKKALESEKAMALQEVVVTQSRLRNKGKNKRKNKKNEPPTEVAANALPEPVQADSISGWVAANDPAVKNEAEVEELAKEEDTKSARYIDRELLEEKRDESEAREDNALAQANELVDRGQYKESVTLFDKYMATQPQDREALLQAAKAAQKAGESEKALEYLNALETLGPGDYYEFGLMEKARTLVALDRKEEAKTTLQKLVDHKGQLEEDARKLLNEL